MLRSILSSSFSEYASIKKDKVREMNCIWLIFCYGHCWINRDDDMPVFDIIFFCCCGHCWSMFDSAWFDENPKWEFEQLWFSLDFKTIMNISGTHLVWTDREWLKGPGYKSWLEWFRMRQPIQSAISFGCRKIDQGNKRIDVYIRTSYTRTEKTRKGQKNKK